MSKCPRCGKTVYFAERQMNDGKEYHGNCLMAHLKEQKEAGKARPFQKTGAENPANFVPADVALDPSNPTKTCDDGKCSCGAARAGSSAASAERSFVELSNLCN
eukprot:CAMPEP_0177651242 /NCGR_PEP_ID=MMETSP0447-20121125/12426_1 /TAXON_ID=0 /ORGANISM="Stygamoeba regulata, Strain BSH-02190019" /LENGTH=103 /DNA_ID=CAMNT_0019154275 /DNA_START=55 /DNA_END=367 /DNA_ORIENTATION=-